MKRIQRTLGLPVAALAAVGALLTSASAAEQPTAGNYNTLVYVDGNLPGDVNGDDGSMAAYAGGGLLCVIFRNETPGNANYMFLQACPGTSASSACGTDDGYYGQVRRPALHQHRLGRLLDRLVQDADGGGGPVPHQRQAQLQLLMRFWGSPPAQASLRATPP
ncbi:hypothetical protein [Streptomyces sp. Agncl-13]|uniref:hypothetical protein n=1 Tax=Streptomyces sp. Agncl-13 TaxID=3400628 RepID=UPI003A8718C8